MTHARVAAGAVFRPEPLRRLWTDRVAARLAGRGWIEPSTRLLDFGCGDFDLGFALRDRVALAVGYDPDAASIRRAAGRAAELRARNVRLTADPGEALARPPTLIVLLSVAQYMTSNDLRETLGRLGAALPPGGRIVLADLLPDGYRPARDALGCLAHALPRGAFAAMLARMAFPVLGGRARTPVRHGRGEVAALAAEAGLSASFETENFTPSRERYTAVLVPRAGPART